MSGKTPVMLYIEKDAKAWLEQHDIKLSHFFMDAFKQYIEGDADAQTKIIVNQIRTLDRERKNLCDELERSTGKRFDQLKIDMPEVSPRTREEVNLQRLYDAMSDDQHAVLHGERTFSDMQLHHVRNWIDARKEDFGLIISADAIIEKLRDNGFGPVKPEKSVEDALKAVEEGTENAMKSHKAAKVKA